MFLFSVEHYYFSLSYDPHEFIQSKSYYKTVCFYCASYLSYLFPFKILFLFTNFFKFILKYTRLLLFSSQPGSFAPSLQTINCICSIFFLVNKYLTKLKVLVRVSGDHYLRTVQVISISTLSEFMQQDGRKKRTAKCLCVINVTRLLIGCFVMIFT